MRELVIFDIDNTLIRGQSQKILLKYLFKRKLISRFYYIKVYLWFVLYKLGFIKSPKKIMEYAFKFLRNRKIEEVNKIADDFFETVLKNFIFTKAVDIINEHKSKNREILLLSNAINIIIKRIAQFLGIKNYTGTNLEIVDNKFTGKIIGNIVYGEEKIKCINDFIKANDLTLNNSWAYGDHISDLHILKKVKYPVVVNPDKFLKKEANKRNWPILFFRKLIK